MKKRWWLWLLITLACMIVIFIISELTGVSIVSIFGWGTLGVFGIVALIVSFLFLGTFAFMIAFLIKLLLPISNMENRAFIMGILGFCAILIGYFLNTKTEWSIFIIMVGFAIGCVAGAVYQEGLDIKRYEPQRIPDNEEGTDEEDKYALFQAMSTEQLIEYKIYFKKNKSVVKLIDEILAERGKANS